VRALQGQEEGIAQMRQGLDAFAATGAEFLQPYWHALLAEACGKNRPPAEGLTVLEEALTLAEKHAERWWEVELHRLKGELLLAHPGSHPTEAERCFRQALEVARRQQAKALELRAALSLSRLWQRQGQYAAARQLLAPIYGWFTEGFGTADLQDARALLEELAGEHG
jgi:predicted ATPase